jgi:hypothetical protein
MESKPIIKARFYEFDKICYSVWSIGMEKVNLHYTFRGMDFCTFHVNGVFLKKVKLFQHKLATKVMKNKMA